MGNWRKLDIRVKFSVWENSTKVGTVILPIYIDLLGNDGAELNGTVHKVDLNDLGFLSFEEGNREYILEV